MRRGINTVICAMLFMCLVFSLLAQDKLVEDEQLTEPRGQHIAEVNITPLQLERRIIIDEGVFIKQRRSFGEVFSILISKTRNVLSNLFFKEICLKEEKSEIVYSYSFDEVNGEPVFRKDCDNNIIGIQCIVSGEIKTVKGGEKDEN